MVKGTPLKHSSRVQLLDLYSVCLCLSHTKIRKDRDRREHEQGITNYEMEKKKEIERRYKRTFLQLAARKTKYKSLYKQQFVQFIRVVSIGIPFIF